MPRVSFKRRLARVGTLKVRYPGAEDASDDPRPRRIALVERNVPGNSPPFWLSFHDTPEAAAFYWLGQEAREDWEPVGICNLDTGEFSVAHLSLAFVLIESLDVELAA